MSTSPAGPYRLHVLGAPELRAPDGRRVRSVLSQPKRLGLLTYLALAPGPVTRASLVALFWPESDEGRARNALSQAVFYLRRSLDEDLIQNVEGDRLWVPPERLWCDARELLLGEQPSAAVLEAATGSLLQGWNADESQPLQEWLDGERRKARERAQAAEASARTAETELGTEPGPPGLDTLGSPPAAASGSPADQIESAGRRAPAPTRWRARTGAWLAPVAVVVAAAVGAFFVRPSVERLAPDAIDLAVLMPSVVSTPDAPMLSAQAIDDEVLAHLPELEGLRIRDVSYAGSLADLRRQLAAVGASNRDIPEWILDTRVRAGRDQARVVGLLYRGPAFDVVDREGFDVEYLDQDAVLLQVPQEIARGVVRIVEEALGREGR